ncbi:hypothetical protein CYLTODRAFT_495579 [Cylindrobasidium torrendii FP15055 ss-10]|uniref:C2H2-type domain-containing protein n=1 Tax=Cylindrobasidium torrendii FP15055 ss-10 TaxID=1314674 RepID=A0A0D7ARB9_9AGAR|nr:hypothetical protein CYLTODRAFT_495579 [Cylindrobasidium torrendii FP15055 ss-10]
MELVILLIGACSPICSLTSPSLGGNQVHMRKLRPKELSAASYRCEHGQCQRNRGEQHTTGHRGDRIEHGSDGTQTEWREVRRIYHSPPFPAQPSHPRRRDHLPLPLPLPHLP